MKICVAENFRKESHGDFCEWTMQKNPEILLKFTYKLPDQSQLDSICSRSQRQDREQHD